MATKIAFDTHIARANLVSATCPAMFNEFKAISPKTQGENVKTLAQHFQVAIHFHPGHPVVQGI